MATDRQPVEAETIITVTEAAREKLLDVLDQQNLRGRAAVRIGIKERGPSGFSYAMALEETDRRKPDDVVLDEGDFQVFIDASSARHLNGATVNFVGQLMGGGFQIDNPNPAWDDPLAEGIYRLIEREVNPSVAGHGGHVELIDVKDNKVYVRLGGGCQGCGMVDVTLRQGIEVLIKEAYPQVEGVVDTTDHAGGSNPYFEQSKGGGASPMYQPSKGGGPAAGGHEHAAHGAGGCGAPGCGAGGGGGGGCGAPGCGGGPHYQSSKG